MKTYRNLYSQIYEWDNLYRAYRQARKGKRSRSPAATFEYGQEFNLLQLQQELEEKRYTPGPYQSFYIHEPKRRLISAAPFRDRVVHHALCNIIEPIFERSFIDDSYANRIGKGTHRALDRAQQFARRFNYVLQYDLRQFFPALITPFCVISWPVKSPILSRPALPVGAGQIYKLPTACGNSGEACGRESCLLPG